MSTIDHQRPRPEPLLVRVEEAAKLLGLGRSTLYEMMQQGLLPFVQHGRSRRIPLAALREWVAKNTTYHS